MEGGHSLTILGSETYLRHPRACTGTDCAVRAAVKVSDSVSLFSDGLYAVSVTQSGTVHLVQLHQRRVLVAQ